MPSRAERKGCLPLECRRRRAWVYSAATVVVADSAPCRDQADQPHQARPAKAIAWLSTPRMVTSALLPLGPLTKKLTMFRAAAMMKRIPSSRDQAWRRIMGMASRIKPTVKEPRQKAHVKDELRVLPSWVVTARRKKALAAETGGSVRDHSVTSRPF